MTDAELIYLLRMHISDIKWHREPDLSEGTVKVLGANQTPDKLTD